MRVIRVTSLGEQSLVEAQRRAQRCLAAYLSAPMALSWFDWQTRHGFPDFECCAAPDDCQPGWLVFGDHEHGEIRVDVGDRFSFIFRESGHGPTSLEQGKGT